MRILDRLVVVTFLRLFLVFLFGAPLLFILADATENLDRYLAQGVTLRDAAVSYAYQYPQFFFWSFPIAALLAAVFTIHPMTVHREVMAAKAGRDILSPARGPAPPDGCCAFRHRSLPCGDCPAHNEDRR